MNGLAKRAAPFFITIVRLALGISLMGMAGMASANKPDNITDAEMKVLPRYCPDTMGFNYGDAYTNTSPRAGHWVALMGKGFWNMHHYCWAQINLLRAQRNGVSRQFKQGILGGVRSDYQYVLSRSPADFIMRPEVLTRLGEVELMLANPNAANIAFSSARELKPDYWPAYSHWAEYLIRAGKKAEAKQLLQTGLEYAPNAKVLVEQYRMVGGKPSDIVPKAKAPEQETDIPAPVSTPVEKKETAKDTPETKPATKTAE
jgi:tetratricopeptide (TPR) repeat protein